MLLSLKKMLGFELAGKDGGSVKAVDIFFDLHTWEVRHFVGQAGHFWNPRQVLIPPAAVGQPDWEDQCLPVDLTKKEIAESPLAGSDLPECLWRHPSGSLGGSPFWEFLPMAAEIWDNPLPAGEDGKASEVKKTNTGLVSLKYLLGRAVEAGDGPAGHVEDLVASVEEGRWVIWAVVVNLSHWISGKRVVVPRSAVGTLMGLQEEVYLTLDGPAVRSLPSFLPETPVNETVLHKAFDYYGRSVEPF